MLVQGWGEGVRTLQIVLRIPNPLILSFSPISAFTRVFDALWGRRDAACRPTKKDACHDCLQKLAQRTPSPQRGEGWGEGVRKIQNKTRPSEPPHPVLLPSGEKVRSWPAAIIGLP